MGVSTRAWGEDEYSRIYWTIVDDDKFVDVYDDDRRFAAYVRLLMGAEATYPSAAPIPRWLADDVLEHLVAVRIVEVVRESSYRVVGLQSEREGRLGGNRKGGVARVAGAQRDEHGRFLAGETLDNAGDAGLNAGSPAGPANAGSSEPARRGRGLDSDEKRISTESEGPARANGRADVLALRGRGWKRVTAKQRAVLDEVAERHEAGVNWAALVIQATPRESDPLTAVLEADRLWQAAEHRRIDVEERRWQAQKDGERQAADEVAWLKGVVKGIT